MGYLFFACSRGTRPKTIPEKNTFYSVFAVDFYMSIL